MAGEEKLQLLVVGISEGRYFPARPGHCLVVESNFSGKSLSTDPVPHLTSPHVNTELCWEISQKQLQQHRLHRTPLKLVLCALDNRSKAREQVGYLLLDLRTAQQRPAKGHWVRLLNVSYPRLKPEIFVILTQEPAAAADGAPAPSLLDRPDPSPASPPPRPGLPRMTLDPKHGYFIVEEEQTAELQRLLFALTFTIQSVLSPENYPAYGSSHSDATLRLVYSLLGSQIQSETFSLTLGAESERTDQRAELSSAASTTFKPERITMRIFSSRESLHLVLTGHSPVSLTLFSEEHAIASGEMPLLELSASLFRPHEALPTHIEKHIRLLPRQAESTALNEQLISLSVSASLRIDSSPEQPLAARENETEAFVAPPPPFPDLDGLHLAPPDPPSPLLQSPDVINPVPLPPAPPAPEDSLTFCFTIDIPTITNHSLPPEGSYSLHYLYPFFSLTHPIEIPLPASLPLSQPQRIHSSCCMFDLSSPLSLLMEHTQTEPLQIQLYSQSQPVATSTVLLSSVFSHAVSPRAFSHSMSSPLLSRAGTLAELQINLSLAPANTDTSPHLTPDHQTAQPLPPTVQPTAEPVQAPQVQQAPRPAPLERALASSEYREALQLEIWKEREETEFRDRLRSKEAELLERLAQEWSRQETGQREDLESKSRQYEELQSELRSGLQEVRERGGELDLREQELQRREQSLSLQLERWEGERGSLRREVTAECEQKLSIERGRLVLSEEKIKTLQERLEEADRRLKQRDSELQRVMEESRTKPEAKLQAELTVSEAEKGKLEQQLSQALQAKQQYRQQWGRALQELAKMRQQEYAVSQAKLKQEQQELEQLRHAYMQREDTQGELQRTKQELEQLQATAVGSRGSFVADKEEQARTMDTLSLSGSMRGGPVKNELEAKIARWVEQRNILLQTGVYSRDDPTIVRLDENINAALNANK